MCTTVDVLHGQMKKDKRTDRRIDDLKSIIARALAEHRAIIIITCIGGENRCICGVSYTVFTY